MKKKTIVSAVTSLALCSSLVVGATYALFTSESKTNIAITSGTVEVKATIGELALYSPTSIGTDGKIVDDTNAASGTTFKNGGTAQISENLLTLDKVTPGDEVSFPIEITNNSDVSTLYRLVVQSETPENGSVADSMLLFSALDFKIDKTDYSGVTYYATEWAPLKAKEDIADLSVEIAFPTTAGNDYQNLSTAISFAVEAVQGNTDTTVVAPADLSTLMGEGAKELSGKLSLGALNATLQNEGGKENLAIGDANLKASGVTEIVFNGGVIDTPFNGNVKGTAINHVGDAGYDGGTAHVYNEVNGSKINLSVPANTKVVFNDLTVNGYYNFNAYQITDGVNIEFNNCTFNGGWVGQTHGFASITFNGCRFTLDGVDTVNVKNTNPLWIGSNANQKLTLDSCIIEGNRPIKYDMGILKVTNCLFKLTAEAYDTNNNRLDRLTALRFDGNATIDEISGNTMVGGYAFYQTDVSPYAGEGYVDTNNKKSESALWRVEY